jgi:hypothetical protein
MVHSADTFSALMNLANLGEAASAKSSAASAMSALLPNGRTPSGGALGGRRGPAKDTPSKTDELANPAETSYLQSGTQLLNWMSARMNLNLTNAKATATRPQSDSVESKGSAQAAGASGQTAARASQTSPATEPSSGKEGQVVSKGSAKENTASPAPAAAQEADAGSTENGLSVSASPDASEAAAAGQAPVAGLQNADFGSEMIGAAAATKNPAESLDNSKMGKANAVSTQPAAKTEGSDKNFRAQQKGGNDSGLAGSAQASTLALGQVKQVAMMDKAENSLGQNSPPQPGPTPNPSSANAGEIFKGHAPTADNQAHPPGADEAEPPTVNTAAPLGSVQTAHLAQQLSESELRVGIQAGEFGRIDIHTSMSQSQISARIYVEHDELGKAMAGALPQLHEKLATEHRMDAQIELYNTGSSHSNGADRQQHQQQRTTEQNGSVSRDADDSAPRVESVQEPLSTAAATGLDMHV